MNNTILKNIIRFIFLILLQVIIFNNIHFFKFITPNIYLLFILLLPFETPKWLLLFLGFSTGITMDIFDNTLGLHTIACTFSAYIRPWVTTVISTKQDYEPGAFPGIKSQGFSWFFKYSLIIVTVHDLIIFYLEIFKLSGFFETLWRAILNIIFTMIFILVIQRITEKSK